MVPGPLLNVVHRCAVKAPCQAVRDGDVSDYTGIAAEPVVAIQRSGTWSTVVGHAPRPEPSRGITGSVVHPYSLTLASFRLGEKGDGAVLGQVVEALIRGSYPAVAWVCQWGNGGQVPGHAVDIRVIQASALRVRAEQTPGEYIHPQEPLVDGVPSAALTEVHALPGARGGYESFHLICPPTSTSG